MTRNFKWILVVYGLAGAFLAAIYYNHVTRTKPEPTSTVKFLGADGQVKDKRDKDHPFATEFRKFPPE